MIYLIMTIIAVIILVAVAIRRLPYLRSHRLGLEIMSPRPYAPRSALWSQIWYRVQGMWQSGLSFGRRSYAHTPNFAADTVVNPVMTGATFAIPETSVSSFEISEATSTITEVLPTTAHPGDFWHEEAAPAPLEIPTKGLITRRGESQKIAQELVSQADEAFRKRDFKESEKYYLQAAAKDPDNARIYNRLGVIYLQTKNYKDAVDAFRGALRFDDRVASRHYNLALAYLGKRDYRSAEKGLKEAIRLEPTNDKYRKTLMAIQKQTA